MHFSPNVSVAKDSVVYDTAAIRREARKIQRCCNHIDNSALPRVKGARSQLDGNFKGHTADVLDNNLTEAQSKLKKLHDELNSLYLALMKYADALEEADRKMAQLMQR